jgi:transketolase
VIETASRVERVRERALEIRRLVVRMAYASQTSHVGGGLSASDILAALYFDLLRVRPEEPGWPERDRFILSKGHAAAVWYAALALRGYFPMEELKTYRKFPTRLQGHPELGRPAGVEFMSGSLGHGLAGALGMALGARLNHNGARCYAVLGDGEVQEGLVWEASLAAVNLKAGNLCALLDYNHQQSGGSVDLIAPLEPVVDKWRAFGWVMEEVDGHDVEQLLAALDRFVERSRGEQPTFVVCHTVKGKGVSFMENDNRFHGSPPNKEEYVRAMAELGVDVPAEVSE